MARGENYTELWDLYTKNKEKLNQTMERSKTQPKNTYRLAVHICLFNSKGEILVQQRQPFKKAWSNMWDVSVGGSVIAGETSDVAARRELLEELGIDISFEKLRASLTVNFEGGFDDFYLIEKDIELTQLKLQYEEVKAVKWASKDEIIKMINNHAFIPYNAYLIELLLFMRSHAGAHTKIDTTSVKLR